MYKLYSIARGKSGIQTCVFDCYDNGKSIKDSVEFIETNIAKQEIQDALNEGLMVIKLPIDDDSDHYNKFVVKGIPATSLCSSEEMDENIFK